MKVPLKTKEYVVFLFTDEYFEFDYGETHPFKINRLKLVYDLIKIYGLFDHPSLRIIKPYKATEEEILTYHSSDYVKALKEANKGEWDFKFTKYGLGPGDNPVFKGLWDFSLLVCGGSLLGAKMISKAEAKIVFNIAGGLHHAHPSCASGFCYLNDPVLAIKYLNEQGFKVAYVDIDAHHGDGVQEAFYETDKILTISLHQDGRTLFPETGFIEEKGKGLGEGYSINVPLPPGTDDDIFKEAIDSIVIPALNAFSPDVLVTQLGVDAFYNDPLANLSLSTNGFTYAVEKLKDFSLPWLALGGGGYNIPNLARAWTLALSIMLGLKLEDKLPQEGQILLSSYNYLSKNLRDTFIAPSPVKHRILETVRREIKWLNDNCLSLIG